MSVHLLVMGSISDMFICGYCVVLHLEGSNFPTFVQILMMTEIYIVQILPGQYVIYWVHIYY